MPRRHDFTLDAPAAACRRRLRVDACPCAPYPAARYRVCAAELEPDMLYASAAITPERHAADAIIFRFRHAISPLIAIFRR